MNTWIALLRGINMVGKRKLPMKELIPLLEGLGARDVKTYHQSGNAVFRHRGKNATRLAGSISAAVGKAYGFEPLVMLLEVEQLARIIAENPFPEAESEPGALVVGFLATVPEQPDLEMLEAVRRKSERFALCGDVFYFYAPEGFHKTKLGGKLERALGVGKAGTGRTLGTLVKVMAIAKDMG
jgi:uncharacterized protein (DUF1697 family)